MFKVRPEQSKALSAACMENFEARLASHLKEFFAVQCTALGESGLRKEIRLGIEKAAKYGIQTEKEICLFLDLQFACGKEFDKDPRYPWASSILNDRSYPDPQTRMQSLYEVAELKLKEERLKHG